MLAGGKVLATAVRLVCGLLQDTLNEDLGAFGISIPDEKNIPMDLPSLQKVAPPSMSAT